MNIASQVAAATTTACHAGLNWPEAFSIVGSAFAFVALIYVVCKYTISLSYK
jgi:hypothetical protein